MTAFYERAHRPPSTLDKFTQEAKRLGEQASDEAYKSMLGSRTATLLDLEELRGEVENAEEAALHRQLADMDSRRAVERVTKLEKRQKWGWVWLVLMLLFIWQVVDAVIRYVDTYTINHFTVEEQGKRTRIGVPAMEAESVWYKQSTGTGGNPGSLLLTVEEGRVATIDRLS